MYYYIPLGAWGLSPSEGFTGGPLSAGHARRRIAWQCRYRTGNAKSDQYLSSQRLIIPVSVNKVITFA